MSYKRILTIQDISCVGQCSLTVALPILSACGLETAILPSAVLSTHTAGFEGYTFRDLTDDMPAIEEHWKKEGIRFDAVYTGYLGSEKQIDHVLSIIESCGAEGSAAVIDPAMADGGKLYPGFDEAFVCAMKRLCERADYMLPNLTEACLLTGHEYRESYDEKYIDELVSKLYEISHGTVVLTGVGYSADETGVVVYDGTEKKYYRHAKRENSCHGTGDIFSSAFTGALVRGFSAIDAAKVAADYTVACIDATAGDKDHWYGAKFEPAIPELIKMLEK